MESLTHIARHTLNPFRNHAVRHRVLGHISSTSLGRMSVSRGTRRSIFQQIGPFPPPTHSHTRSNMTDTVPSRSTILTRLPSSPPERISSLPTLPTLPSPQKHYSPYRPQATSTLFHKPYPPKPAPKVILLNRSDRGWEIGYPTGKTSAHPQSLMEIWYKCVYMYEGLFSVVSSRLD